MSELDVSDGWVSDRWLGPTLVASAYLVGSISFGILMARRRGIDLRAIGSGNIGATNVGRALGKRASWIVLVLDALKGLVPAALARALLGASSPYVAAVGVAAVLGHVLPIWHGFRGGKGAATGVGVLVGAVPVAGGAAAFAYFALRALTRRSSVGSLTAALVGVVAAAVLERASPLTAMAAIIAALIVVRHVDNLRRLVRGEEPPS